MHDAPCSRPGRYAAWPLRRRADGRRARGKPQKRCAANKEPLDTHNASSRCMTSGMPSMRMESVKESVYDGNAPGGRRPWRHGGGRRARMDRTAAGPARAHCRSTRTPQAAGSCPRRAARSPAAAGHPPRPCAPGGAPQPGACAVQWCCEALCRSMRCVPSLGSLSSLFYSVLLHSYHQQSAAAPHTKRTLHTTTSMQPTSSVALPQRTQRPAARPPRPPGGPPPRRRRAPRRPGTARRPRSAAALRARAPQTPPAAGAPRPRPPRGPARGSRRTAPARAPANAQGVRVGCIP